MIIRKPGTQNRPENCPYTGRMKAVLIMESCINYAGCEDGRAWVSSDERRWINRLMRLAAEYPDEVTIKKLPEQNDGCIYGYVPREWVKISPPRRISEDQRTAMAERLKVARESRK